MLYRIINNSKLQFLIGFIIVLTQFSCVSHKNFVYFQTQDQKSIPTQEIQNEIFIKIQPGDLLAIHVSSFDGEAARPFNLNVFGTAISPNNTAPISDYLVDAEGYVDVPGLGKFKVGGLTIPEAKRSLHEKLDAFLKDAIINIRILNFRVNVLGEVRVPGAYTTNEESLNIVEAITQAGDITDFGNRKEVQIIREYDETREFATLNLLSADIFESPYYYLRQNDIIYVPPQRTKTTTLRFQPLGAIVLPLAGVTISLISLLITLNNQ